MDRAEKMRRKYFKRDLLVGMLLNVLILLPGFCLAAARYPI